ncbi:hypothetical protein [Enterobacter hormaechei]|uniref:hypothetical protein n=1 Tax=Enterobacter hormaechei TaxID=158836 RepID=UPI003D6DC1DD
MNKKYKLLTITLFVFFSGILVTISNMTKSGNVNRSGTLQMNSPGDQEFLFNGTISVVIRPGTESIISIFGTSVSARQPSPINTHLVNRDITFTVLSRNKSDFYLSDMKTTAHPGDSMTETEASGLLFDMFDLENNRLTVRRYLNTFVFGDVPLPLFICVKKR